MSKSEITYEALSSNDEHLSGVYKGTKEQFKHFIKSEDITLLSYKEKKIRLKSGKFVGSDFQSFVEELYYLIGSGMKIDDSLKLLLKNTQKEIVSEFIKTILENLKTGEQLSRSIELTQEKLSLEKNKLALSVISSGEEVGALAGALKTLSEYLLFKEKISSEIKQAMSYPIFLIIMSTSMVFFVFFFIVPKFTEIFSPEELDNLPAISQMVLKAGLYVNEHSSIVLMSMGAFVALLPFAFRLFKKNLHRFILKIPMIGKLTVYIELSRIFNSIGIMLQGGIKIDKALKQSVSLTEIDELKAIFKECLFEIKKGNKLSDTLAGHALLPPQVASMVSVGENSAKLDEVFLNLALRFSESFQKQTKSVLALLEPAIIVLMGIFIAVIVVSIMLAVISISDLS
ncbi:type II secretion system F family protein [Sulfurimonas sp. MAG313]|nr:type II secretion system F family protein [Sulfurimonas sp. MAG313]MDF1881736.1 type II secretion system F family protein [Sulfurimonas sp. MAG313]